MIADNAVAAMKLVFDTAVAQLPASNAAPGPTPSPGHDKKDHGNKGDRDGEGD